MSRTIAVFVSPHGFGHAARVCAVMEALFDLQPDICFEIFTQVPSWFFQASLTAPFTYHCTKTDVGMVQASALDEDLDDTIRQLDKFWDFADKERAAWVRQVQAAGCVCVICDIAPVGIQVAREAGIASVLIENFTWDWIYRGYVEKEPRFQRQIDRFAPLFEAADWHIQAQPFCHPAPADLKTAPISRATRQPRETVRSSLGVSPEEKMVFISMGGIPQDFHFIERLTQDFSEIRFLISSQVPELTVQKNLILLPYHTELFHPDLVHASDTIIGKVGYSTIAEVYYAGIPFGHALRPRFRESPELARFVEQRMSGMAFTERQFNNGDWTEALPELLKMKSQDRSQLENGRIQAAEFIVRLLMGD